MNKEEKPQSNNSDNKVPNANITSNNQEETRLNENNTNSNKKNNENNQNKIQKKEKEIFYDPTADPTDMDKVIAVKSQILIEKSIKFKLDKKEIQKIIIKEGPPNKKKIKEDCEVRFKIQKYFYNKKTDQFFLCNKSYKNPVKKSISKMTNDEAIIRKLLLQSFDDEILVFIVDKNIDLPQYNLCMIESKLSEEDFNENYESNLYYRILIEKVSNTCPKAPANDLKKYFAYIRDIYSEVRYQFERKNFDIIESWSNTAISSIYGMNKKLKAVLDKDPTLYKKDEIMEYMTKIISIKISAALQKEGDDASKKKLYLDVIKSVNEHYYKNNKKFDELYLKITYKLGKLYIKVNKFEQVPIVIQNIKANCKDLKDQKNVTDAIEALSKEGHINQKEEMQRTKKKINANREENHLRGLDYGDYDWGESLQDEDLFYYLQNTKMNNTIHYLIDGINFTDNA